MVADEYDEEGLLKIIRAFELSEQNTKLNWNWNNLSDPIKLAHELLNKSQHLLLEISEYEQRMGDNLSGYQRNEIEKAMDNLSKLIPYIKNKIETSLMAKDTKSESDLI